MNKPANRPCLGRLLALVVMFAWFVRAQGQQVASSGAVALPDLPDAPRPAQTVSQGQAIVGGTTPPPQAETPAEPKRIFGIFPNFREVTVDDHLPPQTVKEKFTAASDDSFDYSAIVVPAIIAGEQEASNSVPEFHKGAVGFGRYFWHSAVDQTSENYIVEFIVPTLTHEDTRYYALYKKRQRAWKRAGYALSRLVVTRSDSGNETFNVSEIFGAALGASISNLYYPAPERTVGKTMGKYATNVGLDGFAYLVREFWPDASHILFHGPDAHLTP